MDCRRSFERLALASALLLTGCRTVRPEEKERLADPAMVYGSGGQAARQEEHVLDNREGASGGEKSAGGCGCN